LGTRAGGHYCVHAFTLVLCRLDPSEVGVTADGDGLTDSDFQESARNSHGEIISNAVADAVGKASEALEYIERARGHLYSFHQLMGRADLVFGEAVDGLADAGLDESSKDIDRIVVGRNVLDGRWSFQIVEEFDELYYVPVSHEVRSLEHQHTGGHRHVHEARMKEDRRTKGHPGHEHRPAGAHDSTIEIDASTE